MAFLKIVIYLRMGYCYKKLKADSYAKFQEVSNDILFNKYPLGDFFKGYGGFKFLRLFNTAADMFLTLFNERES